MKNCLMHLLPSSGTFRKFSFICLVLFSFAFIHSMSLCVRHDQFLLLLDWMIAPEAKKHKSNLNLFWIFFSFFDYSWFDYSFVTWLPTECWKFSENEQTKWWEAKNSNDCMKKETHTHTHSHARIQRRKYNKKKTTI